MTLSHALFLSLSACIHKYARNYYYCLLKKLTHIHIHTRPIRGDTKAIAARSSHLVYNNNI